MISGLESTLGILGGEGDSRELLVCIASSTWTGHVETAYQETHSLALTPTCVEVILILT